MRPSQFYQLDKWVKDNKSQIQLAQPPQKKLAAQATEDLGFKVSVAALRDVLVENGIVRMTKAEREVAVLREELDRTRKVLLKVLASAQVADWLRAELLDQDLDDEVKSLLQRKAS